MQKIIPEIVAEKEQKHQVVYLNKHNNYCPEDLIQALVYDDFMAESYGYSGNICSDISKSIFDSYISTKHSSDLMAQYIMATRKDVAINAMSSVWNKYKIVYKPDKDLINDLLLEDVFVLIPDMLRHMNYPHFYIDLSAIDIFECVGCFVSVMEDYENTKNINIVICPLSSRYVNDSKIEVGKDAPVHVMHLKSNTIFSKQSFSNYANTIFTPQTGVIGKMNQIIKKINKKWILNESMTIPTTENIHDLYLFIYQFLTFLVSKEPDIQQNKVFLHSKERAIRMGDQPSDVQMWDVGSRYGQTIRLYEQKNNIKYNDTETVHKQNSSHKTPRPHTRRGHWHRYWTGKGKTVCIVKWVSPILCCISETNKNIATVQEVTDKEPKGYKGENLIKEYLLTKNVIVRHQYYEGHIGRRYDFLVKKQASQMIIEFDGEQHFKPIKHWGDMEGLKKNIEADNIKTKWCEESHIPLLRIRYDQKGHIPEMIDDLLKNPNFYLVHHNTYLTEEQYYSKRKNYL